jgi:hypothetical protein
MTDLRHDKDLFIREAKQRIKSLEQILIREKEEIGKDKDLGWDVTSMIEEFGHHSKEDN